MQRELLRKQKRTPRITFCNLYFFTFESDSKISFNIYELVFWYLKNQEFKRREILENRMERYYSNKPIFSSHNHCVIIELYGIGIISDT